MRSRIAAVLYFGLAVSRQLSNPLGGGVIAY
jgi:hypothetical protein